jgi:glycosyltransferase involved in cell wall biosynthesis
VQQPALESPIRFSIVIAVYNVARYLDEFIASVESQTFPRERFEVVAVNDGSTDDSLDRLRAWEAAHPELVTVVEQANTGLPGARNAGLPHARGEWVTFADPDDRLTPDYLAEVDAFLREHPETGMVATKLLVLNDTTGEIADRHPLRRRFHKGNQLRFLDEHPDHFHGHAPSAFFPHAELLRQELRFDQE